MPAFRSFALIALLFLAGCSVLGAGTCKPPPDPADPDASGPAMPTTRAGQIEGGDDAAR